MKNYFIVICLFSMTSCLTSKHQKNIKVIPASIREANQIQEKKLIPKESIEFNWLLRPITSYELLDHFETGASEEEKKYLVNRRFQTMPPILDGNTWEELYYEGYKGNYFKAPTYVGKEHTYFVWVGGRVWVLL